MNLFPPTVKTVLFDLDGTLIDSFEAFYQICKQGCEVIGHPIPERANLFPVMNEGKSFSDICFPSGMPQRQAVIDAFRAACQPVRLDYLARYAHLMPDAANLIRHLHAAKYKLAIITSSRRESLKPLDRAGLTAYFDVIVTRDEVKELKPHPEGVEMALRQLQSNPEHTLMFGDTPMDIGAGKAAGTQTAGVLSSTENIHVLKKSNPDLLFTSLSGLGAWLDLDAARKTESIASVLLQGTYSRGLGAAAAFLSIDWVFQSVAAITGFKPFPGTFNLDLSPSSAHRLAQFRNTYDHVGHLLRGKPGYCDAVLYPCRLQTQRAAADAYALFPMASDYPPHKLEVVAPYRLIERLGTDCVPDVHMELYI